MGSERRKPPSYSLRPSSAAGKAKPQQQAELKAMGEARQNAATRGNRARKSSVTPQELEAMTRALDSLNADWDDFKAHQPVGRRLSVLVIPTHGKYSAHESVFLHIPLASSLALL